MSKISLQVTSRKISQEKLFMLSILAVNAGNYFYNLILGRYLGPKEFADSASIVTFLLIISFIAMTFQMATAKFSILLNKTLFRHFLNSVYTNALIVGGVLGVSIVVFAKQLQVLFNTQSSSMFVLFGIGVPFYFAMSVNRGVFQGKKAFILLSVTYQGEMLSRLFFTFLLLLLLKVPATYAVSLGIVISFFFGLIPLKIQGVSLTRKINLPKVERRVIRNFFILTAFYELTQIIINNSDILLVKHYFESYEAGLYASLALIGRIVYFIAWMFVMLLFPKLIELKKEGKDTTALLWKYVSYISCISAVIIGMCFLFPQQIIQLLFGDAYISMGSLLWKYSFATGVFAISNIFAYYFLSLSNYVPVIVSGLFGCLQVLLIMVFHRDLAQVVNMQIIAMLILLTVQLLFFGYTSLKTKRA
ncbi:MAG: sugar isomerase [Flavobacteriaceae bacterium]|nr:sugar isomerase [Flavobacteriaceae bacterium]